MPIHQLLVATPFNPVTHTYTSGTSATETIPPGAVKVTISVWGAGGAGGFSGTAPVGGGGGGGGAYCESDSVACAGNETLIYTVGQGAAGLDGTDSVVSSGTLSIATMTAGGGGVGSGTSGSSGGTASGGTTSNHNGFAGADGSGSVNGQGGNNGLNQATPGGGAAGRYVSSAAGDNGQISFSYS